MRTKKRKVFQPGLIYVFSYKKFKETSRKFNFPKNGWARALNGRLVTPNVNPDRAGTILGTGLFINIKWCKCIGGRLKNEKRTRASHNRFKASRTKFPICG